MLLHLASWSMFTLDRLKVNLKISNCILLFKDTQLMNVSKDYHGIFFKMDVYLVYSCTETINKSIEKIGWVKNLNLKIFYFSEK